MMRILGNDFFARKHGAQGHALVLVLVGAAFVSAANGGAVAQQASQPMGDMQGMDMSGGKGPGNGMSGMTDAEMKAMGPSMAAMAGHMYVTPLRPIQPGDEERAKALVATVKATIEKYKDYKKALADGYVIANPKVDQPQAHFISDANEKEAATHFDPTKPSALLYRKTPTQRYKLEGVMFTAEPGTTEDELNARVPLSIARWHIHENFCAAPADRVKEYLGAHPKFGMFGSIRTAEACKAEGGTFLPTIFNWMIHVFPYQDNFKDIFSMNDDIPHS
jgi:hypothetical protein